MEVDVSKYLGPIFILAKTHMTCSISSGSALFAKTKTIFRKEMQFYLEFITCEPCIYAMDHPKFIQGSDRNSKSQFRDFSMIIHNQ